MLSCRHKIQSTNVNLELQKYIMDHPCKFKSTKIRDEISLNIATLDIVFARHNIEDIHGNQSSGNNEGLLLTVQWLCACKLQVDLILITIWVALDIDSSILALCPYIAKHSEGR